MFFFNGESSNNILPLWKERKGLSDFYLLKSTRVLARHLSKRQCYGFSFNQLAALVRIGLRGPRVKHKAPSTRAWYGRSLAYVDDCTI